MMTHDGALSVSKLQDGLHVLLASGEERTVTVADVWPLPGKERGIKADRLPHLAETTGLGF